MKMSVPVVTWQCHCCHLVPPAEMPPPHTAAATIAVSATAKAPLQQPFCLLHPKEHLNQHQKAATTNPEQPRERALPSNAFWALSASSWFLSGCTNIDSCKRKDLAIKIMVKDEEYFRDFWEKGNSLRQKESKEIAFLCTWTNQLTTYRSMCQYKSIEQTIPVTNRLSKKSCSLWYVKQFKHPSAAVPGLIWTPWSLKTWILGLDKKQT